ncbi:hypothetical protein ACN077_24535 [Clostridium chromiireducens]|uniref:hypothetical protein n=1 Tax=Clostridium chromiireducens TaxID=225345 RepID=UPI003AF6F908
MKKANKHKKRENRKSNTIVKVLSNPIVVGIIAPLLIFVAGLYYSEKKDQGKIETLINQADIKLSNKNYDQALLDYQEACKNISKESLPRQYAYVNKQIGKILINKNNEKDLTTGITLLKNSLEFYKDEEYPVEFHEICENIGIGYTELSRVKDKIENLNLSIEYFSKNFNLKNSKISEKDIDSNLVNLATAYSQLIEFEDADKKIDSLEKCIDTYTELLKTFNKGDYPFEYATIQLNLGNSFKILSDYKNRADNIKLAVQSCLAAGDIFTVEKFPEEYGKLCMDLGVIYRNLSEIEDKKINLNKSLQSNRDALLIFKSDDKKYEEPYVEINSNLVITYLDISEIEDDKKENIELAITSANNALEKIHINTSPIVYAGINMNLGKAYAYLSQIENEKDNLEKTIQCLNEAEKVFTARNYRSQYSKIQYNKSFAYYSLSKIVDKAENEQKALEALEKYKLNTLSN